MGIFDKLKKILGGSTSSSSYSSSSARSNMRYDAQPEIKSDFVYKTENVEFRQVHPHVKQNFDSIMHELSEFEVETEVNADSLFSGAEKWYRPYSYALYRDGNLAGLIMLINDGSRKTPSYKGSKEIGEKAGIPVITFFGGLPNEEEYVINRIRNALR
jgi:hypothetical protein